MTALRPLQPSDIAVLESQHSSVEAAGEHSWFGFRDRGRLQRLLDAGTSLRDDGGLLVVVDADDVVGEVSWHLRHNAPPPHGNCWNVGVWIAPEHRGKGHGTRAQRLLSGYLFEHTQMERIEAGTESGNVAEQRALEKAGFTREGVLRRACFRGGQWRDMVVFSKLREEP